VRKSIRKTRVWALLSLAAVVVSAAVAVGAGAVTEKGAAAPSKVTIAYQPGVGYAPIIMIREQKLIEKKYPGIQVDWKILSSATPITNGIIAGQIDLGAIGVGPLLTGYARGIDWKFLAPLSEADLWLMAKDPAIKSVADLQGKKIAMPSANSIQAVVLRKAAQVKLGNVKALDSSIVSLEHPDGLQALLTGQVSAHLTSPPFQFQELNAGAHIVLRSSTYFGAHTFVGLTGTQKWYDQYTDFANWLYDTIKAQDALIKSSPAKAGALLSSEAGGDPSAQQFTKWLTAKAVSFDTRPRGLMRFANFMNNNGLLNKRPASWNDLVFPPVRATKGS
jgi:ABC-type nitrate/sulfonate/bicarbonate transport system substrate-binding protein